MLTNVLNAPVAELTVSEHINLCYNFFDCRSLFAVSTKFMGQAGLASMARAAVEAI